MLQNSVLLLLKLKPLITIGGTSGSNNVGSSNRRTAARNKHHRQGRQCFRGLYRTITHRSYVITPQTRKALLTFYRGGVFCKFCNGSKCASNADVAFIQW